MGLFDIFTNKNAQDAANAQIAGLNAGYTAASGSLDKGNQALTTNYGAALQPFLQNYGAASAGQTALTDALGITGDPAQVQAKLAATPGYQFQLNQGNENVLRNASRTGSVNSGGTNVDLMKMGQGLADSTYNQYVSQLQPFLGAAGSAAGGIAGVNTGLGTALNANQNTMANLGWQKETGIGNANANADLANNNASANMWGLLMNGGKLAAQAAPAAMAMFSDERLKEDIEPVGELYDGQGVYRYRYKGDAMPRIGLIAQEVEQTNPDAVIEVGGFKAVDYGKATDFASKLSRFLEAA